MPESTIRFSVPGAPAALRALLADPTFVASSIPQVVAVEKLTDTTARWTVQIKIGPISRRSLYQGELLEATDRQVRFRATGPEATIDGTVALAPSTTGGTDVTLTLAMNGTGPLRSVVDAYLAKRVQDDAEKFASQLAARLSAPPGG